MLDKFRELMDSITEEQKKEFELETEKWLKLQEKLEKEGYVYNTPKSYSLKLLNDAGHFPIGITSYACEETFIFKSKRAAKKAWKSRVLGFDGWFYSDTDFNKNVKTDELFNNKVYWLYYKN